MLKRIGATMGALVLTLVLVLGVWALPAAPPSSASDADSVLMNVTGTAHVVLPEAAPVVLQPDGSIEDSSGGGIPGILEIRTDAGVNIPLDPASLPGAQTGDRVSVEVAVPNSLIDELTRSSTQRIELSDDTVQQSIAELAQERGVALDLSQVEVAPPVAAAVAPKAHKVNVALIYPTSNHAVGTQAQVDNLISRLSTYWNSQSNGQVSSITRAGNIQRLTNSYACETGRIQSEFWPQGAAAFGRTSNSYSNSTPSGEHLIVVSVGCGDGRGLGTLNSALHNNGLIWLSGSNTPLNWLGTLTHEFGHNIGLAHSNNHECTPPSVDSAVHTNGTLLDSACDDHEYQDRYDVMGLYMTSWDDQLSSRIPGALNVTHKAKIDSLTTASGSLRKVLASQGSVQEFTLLPAANASGLRGLEITDPKTGEKYYVEYRSGGGMDADAWYARWTSYQSGNGHTPDHGFGVRVLKHRAHPSGPWDYSVALGREIPAVPASSSPKWVSNLQAGDIFANRKTAPDNSSGITLEILSIHPTNGAQVRVTFNTGLNFNVAPTPVITGSAQVSKQLGVDTGTWSPTPTSFTYQWLRNGTAIAGATSQTYVVSGQDAGKNLSIRLTAHRSGYTSTSKTSNAVAVSSGITVNRISGPSRNETAVNVSRAQFTGTAPVVYLATGMNYPDALAAAPAATHNGGALLLTLTDDLTDTVRQRIAELKPARIVIVGGTGVITPRVEQQAKNAWPSATVSRISGAHRYETALNIVRQSFTGPEPTVFMATGQNFPDALSISAVAGSQDAPVVLVNGAAATVDAETLQVLNNLSTTKVIIAGGPGAVSTGIEQQLRAQGYNVERWAGTSREATSLVINQKAYGTASKDQAYFATSLGFPDALAGATLAGSRQAPLYTVLPHCIPNTTLADVGNKSVSEVTLIGGTGVLHPAIEALTTC